MGDGRTWFEVRDPGCVPQLKGPFLGRRAVQFIRELMDARPYSFITVIGTFEDGSPYVEDGPTWLQIADGRSMARGRAHIARLRSLYSKPARP